MEVEGLNTTAWAQLVVAAHPLPYYNDVVWTILGDTGTLQVGRGGQCSSVITAPFRLTTATSPRCTGWGWRVTTRLS